MKIRFIPFLAILILALVCVVSTDDKCGQHCLKCNTSEYCMECQSSYFKATNDTHIECKPCHSKCLECSGKGQDQCLSCPQNLILKDKKCMSLPILRSLNGFCKHQEKLYRCPIGCKSCNCNSLSNQTCIQFLPGFTLGLQQNKILKCQQACLNCQQILTEDNVKVNKCLQCPPTFMLKDFKCQICPDRNCSKCTPIQDKVHCELCIQGFYLTKNQDIEICHKCSDIIPNCINCDQVETILQCSACNLGYYLFTSQNKTFSCEKCLEGCLRCQQFSRNICKQCFKGFVMVNNTCKKCSEGCNQCKIKQNTPEQCSSCSSGYKLINKILQNGTTSKLCTKQCHYTCLECSQDPEGCVSCYDGYIFVSQQKKCVPVISDQGISQISVFYKAQRCPYGFAKPQSHLIQQKPEEENINDTSEFENKTQSFNEDNQNMNSTQDEQVNIMQQDNKSQLSQQQTNQENNDNLIQKFQEEVKNMIQKQKNLNSRHLQQQPQSNSKENAAQKKSKKDQEQNQQQAQLIQQNKADNSLANSNDYCSITCSQNCAECSEDPKNCFHCFPGYFIKKMDNKSRCIACPQNCKLCNNKNYCEICSTGYTYQKSIFNCVKCQSPCKQCVEDHPEICLSCLDDTLYQLKGWKCKLKNKISLQVKINTQYFQFIGKDKTRDFQKLLITSLNNLRYARNEFMVTDKMVSLIAIEQGSVIIKLQIQTSSKQESVSISEDCQTALTKTYKNQFGQILSYKIQSICSQGECGQSFTNANQQSTAIEQNDNTMLFIMFVIVLAIALIITGMILLFQKLQKQSKGKKNVAPSSEKYVMQQDQLFSI